MEKLTIIQASKQFGISRVRLYKLLEGQIIVGHHSKQRGRSSGSWVDADSLKLHIEQRREKLRQSTGRPKAVEDGEYLPVRVAAERIGYTEQNIYHLIKSGHLESKNIRGNFLIHYPSLLEYSNSRKNRSKR